MKKIFRFFIVFLVLAFAYTFGIYQFKNDSALALDCTEGEEIKCPIEGQEPCCKNPKTDVTCKDGKVKCCKTNKKGELVCWNKKKNKPFPFECTTSCANDDSENENEGNNDAEENQALEIAPQEVQVEEAPKAEEVKKEITGFDISTGKYLDNKGGEIEIKKKCGIDLSTGETLDCDTTSSDQIQEQTEELEEYGSEEENKESDVFFWSNWIGNRKT